MNFSKTFSFNQLVLFTVLRRIGQKVETKYRKAYWKTLNERIKCKPPIIPHDQHNTLMLEVEAEITRMKREDL